MSLTIATEIIAVLVAIPLGVLAAWKANSLIDRGVMVFAAIGFSIPIFWLGFILIWIFGLWAFGLDNPILPVAGYTRIDDGLLDYLRHLALPAFSLGLVVIALVARMTRASVLEVLKEDYVRTARAKGLTEKTVLIRHALRSASLPILTIIGLGLAGLLSGAVVTESVFAIPWTRPPRRGRHCYAGLPDHPGADNPHRHILRLHKPGCGHCLRRTRSQDKVLMARVEEQAAVRLKSSRTHPRLAFGTQRRRSRADDDGRSSPSSQFWS